MRLKDAVPVRVRKLLRHPVLYAGRRYECPICGGRFRRLRTTAGRRNAICPRCGSRERHRVVWLYLERETDILREPLKLLQFAPDAIGERLSRQPNIDYLSGDLDPAQAMQQIDITDNLLPDDSFDVVLVSHVLEHVLDDKRAMAELFRVLRPGGLALLQHPVNYAADTYEDSSIQTPKERLKAFQQQDHVRIYGRDLGDRLEAAGFQVSIRRYRDDVAAAEQHLYCLREGTEEARADDIYVCGKREAGSSRGHSLR